MNEKMKTAFLANGISSLIGLMMLTILIRIAILIEPNFVKVTPYTYMVFVFYLIYTAQKDITSTRTKSMK